MSISFFMIFLLMGFVVFSSTISPVLLIVWLIFLRVLSSFFIYSISKWIIYLIIILYVGGIIILFSYIVSLSEKNKSTIKFKKLIFFSLFLLLVVVNINLIKGFFLRELFIFSGSLVLYVLVFYLLFLLCSISKLLIKKNGSLKSLFKNE